MNAHNVGDIKGAIARATDMISRGVNSDHIARCLNAEFHMSAYISSGKIYTQYLDEAGIKQTRVVGYAQ